MDADTIFLVEKIDSLRTEIMTEVKEIRKDLQYLQVFNARIMGMAFVVGILGSASFEIAVLFLKR